MPPLNEVSLRRPGFVPGTPIRLADGQVWQFRRPRVRFVPAHHESGLAVFLTGLRDGFSGLLDRREEMLKPESESTLAELAEVELELGGRMLLANYDLTTEQLAEVLQFSYERHEDPEGWSIREAVMDVAEGNGPKPSTAGDESPPTPAVA
jgi:hypothetical protein